MYSRYQQASGGITAFTVTFCCQWRAAIAKGGMTPVLSVLGPPAASGRPAATHHTVIVRSPGNLWLPHPTHSTGTSTSSDTTMHSKALHAFTYPPWWPLLRLSPVKACTSNPKLKRLQDAHLSDYYRSINKKQCSCFASWVLPPCRISPANTMCDF